MTIVIEIHRKQQVQNVKTMIENMLTQSLRAHNNDTFRKYKHGAAQWFIICGLNKIRTFIMNYY